MKEVQNALEKLDISGTAPLNEDFEKFNLEPLVMTEPQYSKFLKDYLDNKIEKRLADSFLDYEQLITK